MAFLYFPFQKSVHPSLTEMKLQEQRLSSLCKFMCVFWDPVSSGERNVTDVQVLLSSMAKFSLTLVGLGFYSQPSCSQLALICCNIKQKIPVKHLFLFFLAVPKK